MTAPLIASIITGVTIAAVLFFVCKNIYQRPHQYAYEPTQSLSQSKHQGPHSSSKTRRRRRQDTCVICFELLSTHSDIVTLSCDHTLHKTCLQMLQAAQHTKCPLCRGPLSYTS